MPRRLAVFADGTWNTKDQVSNGHISPTNVVKLHQAVDRRKASADGTEQIAHYHEGVGAGQNIFERGFGHVAGALGLKSLSHNLLGGVTGHGLDTNIIDCYKWLVENYQPGDELHLFGFSRGAYTARSLAGFIRNSGLLTSSNAGMVDQAFDLYRNRGDESSPKSVQATEFRKLYSHEVDVTCIGVWDTVGALGIPLVLFKQDNAARYQFHDVTLSSHVKYAFHALAIDEQRTPFAPTMWEQQPEALAAGQVLEQVWFAGVHSNVGGGYADCGPSDTALLWMVERAKRAGLDVDDAYVKQVVCNAAWDAPLEDSFARIYMAQGRYSRPIAKGRKETDDAAGTFDAAKERVDPSALRRHGKTVGKATSAYTPDNLTEYLGRFPSAKASLDAPGG
jgi:uncharacterized protein (DUF2235 family)